LIFLTTQSISKGGSMKRLRAAVSQYRYTLLLTVITGVCLTAFTAYGASTITIDPATRYQTIDGFGGHVSQGYCGDPAFMHNDFGLSLARLRIYYSFQQNNNMNPNDSLNSDITKFSVSAQNEEVSKVNALKTYGDVKFFASCWSPPAWMKDMTRDPLTGTTCTQYLPAMCGGHLAPQYYQAFAGFIVAFCKIIKAQTGVELTAINFQNEPYFIEPYQSCVYTYQEYAAVFKIIAARFQKEGINTKFLAAEDMLLHVIDRPYVQTIDRKSVV
jgi:glucosylceramidase